MHANAASEYRRAAKVWPAIGILHKVVVTGELCCCHERLNDTAAGRLAGVCADPALLAQSRVSG